MDIDSDVNCNILMEDANREILKNNDLEFDFKSTQTIKPFFTISL